MSGLTYTLVVNGSVYGSQSARSAYQFAQAVIEQGHTLVSVFFYQDGVTNGTALSVPANDEFDLTKAWQGLAKEHDVRLETCVAAALRRGIISEDEATQHGLTQNNLAEGFVQAGLGSLAEAMLTQDRVVQF
ncbi:sulfurtransferase complex subunit TusD [Vibrio parahaemolyticus]|uniref:sulfurtransferase complex subunit TusD n=1 Tax=Vibrio parahaemolyticus TaxID=670 RepID=UPI0003F8BEEE|nr:sulfurtransferase complex subunit TusD [Vibrio parahaemolyticus]EGR0399261.1 sulfurtransferase complex subunit TusD [Vibrio parahaemolyticus]EGR1558986.1 sulfurtransferase complex subunit TusD [Vibrio parahaemolyticus]EHK7406255.1 sulfurtransferase complex subunit TusD [Vibrio parahaemolyticus]EJG1650033.1 sulfurtransferase complex subunit TusD [Vibrio parahaemolyticus]EMA2532569.1 sulfurtransferase complex subunit TusD [Vibrio parahaemolyticus]